MARTLLSLLPSGYVFYEEDEYFVFAQREKILCAFQKEYVSLEDIKPEALSEEMFPFVIVARLHPDQPLLQISRNASGKINSLTFSEPIEKLPNVLETTVFTPLKPIITGAACVGAGLTSFILLGENKKSTEEHYALTPASTHSLIHHGKHFFEWYISAGYALNNGTYERFEHFFRTHTSFPVAYSLVGGSFWGFLNEHDLLNPVVDEFVEMIRKEKAERNQELLAWKYEKTRGECLTQVEWLTNEKTLPGIWQEKAYRWNMDLEKIQQYFSS